MVNLLLKCLLVGTAVRKKKGHSPELWGSGGPQECAKKAVLESYMMRTIVSLHFCHLTHWTHLGSENVNGDNACIHIASRQVCIFLINNRCGRAQPMGGNGIPGQLVLRCIRMQAEETVKNKPVNTLPP